MNHRVTGAAMLVTGTSVGAGMLGIPASLATVGYPLSMGLLVLGWAVLLIGGQCIVDGLAHFPDRRMSFFSLTDQILGGKAKSFAICGFFALLYAVMVAYFSGGADVLLGLPWFEELGRTQALAIWMVPFLVCVAFGLTPSEWVNRLMMGGLLGVFAVMVAGILQIADLDHVGFFSTEFLGVSLAIRVIFASYGFHIVIPSIFYYLGKSVDETRKAVTWGSAGALIIYMVWVSAVQVAVGDGRLTALAGEANVTRGLRDLLVGANASPWLPALMQVFSALALASSFLGVSVGLMDLLQDLDPVRRLEFRVKKGLSLVLTFGVPGLCAVFFSGVFMKALAYGGTVVALIHGILPAVLAAKLGSRSVGALWWLISVSVIVILSEVFSFWGVGL